MTDRLLVTEPFGEYAFGDRITDPKIIRKVTSTHPNHVLREAVEADAEQPAPEQVAPLATDQSAVKPAKAPPVTKHTLNDG